MCISHDAFGIVFAILKLVSQIALSYHEQVQLDFECFKDYVKKNFSK